MTLTWPFGDLVPHTYRAIIADPPWHFRARTALNTSNWCGRRDAKKHYRVMDSEEIAGLPVRELAHEDGCHLFLWATGPCLPQALMVLEAWGFRYSSIAFTWIKLRRSFETAQLRFIETAECDFHVGLGLTTRKNSEFVLLGRRGNCKRAAKNVREIILSPVREHSRKPEEMFRRVERYCAGPYAELFARTAREGWDAYGNEVGKFREAAE
jgi:N6-adenosine-specific RNA methylase IME4